MYDLTKNSDAELCLYVWNDEYLYNKVKSIHRIVELSSYLQTHFKYTKAQFEVLLQEIQASQQAEQYLNNLNNSFIKG
jgi:hypothetical protein